MERPVRDDRGVVMLYTAIVACVLLAMFSLTWDVARVSEEKMQAQHAADSAALEMAAWEARGMNMVQHINDEIYDVDKIILVVYTAVAAITGIGIVLRPVFGIGYIIEAVAAPFAYLARLIRFTTVVMFLKPLRYIYANGSMVIGYLAANGAASANGADPILPASLRGSGSGLPGVVAEQLEGALDNFTALGLPTSSDVILTLPLQSDETTSLPLNTQNFKVIIKLMLENTYIYPKDEDFWHWNDKYYQSESAYRNKPLPPMLWFTQKEKTVGLLTQYFLFGLNEKSEDVSVMAYAVGQARGGNVVMYSCSESENRYRPRCFGTGTDAFLVPFDKIGDSSMAQSLGKILAH